MATHNPHDVALKNDIAEMMNGWDKIKAAAKMQFPNATPEELKKIISGAMNHALGLNKKSGAKA